MVLLCSFIRMYELSPFLHIRCVLINIHFVKHVKYVNIHVTYPAGMKCKDPVTSHLADRSRVIIRLFDFEPLPF